MARQILHCNGDICDAFTTVQRVGQGTVFLKSEQFASVWDAIEATPAEAENQR